MPDDEELPERLERILLGGERKYTRLQVAEKAGVDSRRSQRLWRALGFPSVDDDEVVFTDADVEAMRLTDALVGTGLIDPTSETSVARAVGLHLSRLADWQAGLLSTLLVQNPGLAADEAQVERLVERVIPELEQVQSFVWRRHLAAYHRRALAGLDDDPECRTQVVGFADMVGYTRMTRQVDSAELNEMLDGFEELVTEVIAEHHGQVVKMIGDEVLFVAGTPADGAEIALSISERTGEDKPLPAVRAGLAHGRVLTRFGDVYGSVVNLASRLTSVARPGTVLLDRQLAALLTGDEAYELRTIRPVPVSGYGRLRPSALRRADPG